MSPLHAAGKVAKLSVSPLATPRGEEPEVRGRRGIEPLVNSQLPHPFSHPLLNPLVNPLRFAEHVKTEKLIRPEYLAYVHEQPRQCWSPDQIALRWIVYLRQYRRKRRRTKSAGHVDRALEKRPQIVNERDRFGDWEGDTIIGLGRHGGALVSLVERRSGYLALLPVPSKHAKKVRQALCDRLQQIPLELRQTMTLDNGCEFAEYEQLENTLGIEVFFSDPHAPWQKGTNENTNGLTRQFFPKGTNFNQVSRYKVARAENLLKDRPRKRLNYQTSNEVFAQQCQSALHA